MSDSGKTSPSELESCRTKIRKDLETFGKLASKIHDNDLYRYLKDVAGSISDKSSGVVSASSQGLYYSTQVATFNPNILNVSPNLLNFSPDILKVGRRSISVLGREYNFRGENRGRVKKEEPQTPEHVGTAAAKEIPDTREAADKNREIYAYREESQRSLSRIKEIYEESKAFRANVDHNMQMAREIAVREIRLIDEALNGSAS